MLYFPYNFLHPGKRFTTFASTVVVYTTLAVIENFPPFLQHSRWRNILWITRHASGNVGEIEQQISTAQQLPAVYLPFRVVSDFYINNISLFALTRFCRKNVCNRDYHNQRLVLVLVMCHQMLRFFNYCYFVCFRLSKVYINILISQIEIL